VAFKTFFYQEKKNLRAKTKWDILHLKNLEEKIKRPRSKRQVASALSLSTEISYWCKNLGTQQQKLQVK